VQTIGGKKTTPKKGKLVEKEDHEEKTGAKATTLAEWKHSPHFSQSHHHQWLRPGLERGSVIVQQRGKGFLGGKPSFGS